MFVEILSLILRGWNSVFSAFSMIYSSVGISIISFIIVSFTFKAIWGIVTSTSTPDGVVGTASKFFRKSDKVSSPPKKQTSKRFYKNGG